MAGHRRGTGQPTQAQARAKRRRKFLADRLGRARSPVEQVTAAAEYARAALSALSHMDPNAAEIVARELVEVLVAHVDQAMSRR